MRRVGDYDQVLYKLQIVSIDTVEILIRCCKKEGFTPDVGEATQPIVFLHQDCKTSAIAHFFLTDFFILWSEYILIFTFNSFKQGEI
jgi:hypothetical protein